MGFVNRATDALAGELQHELSAAPLFVQPFIQHAFALAEILCHPSTILTDISTTATLCLLTTSAHKLHRLDCNPSIVCGNPNLSRFALKPQPTFVGLIVSSKILMSHMLAV